MRPDQLVPGKIAICSWCGRIVVDLNGETVFHDSYIEQIRREPLGRNEVVAINCLVCEIELARQEKEFFDEYMEYLFRGRD